MNVEMAGTICKQEYASKTKCFAISVFCWRGIAALVEEEVKRALAYCATNNVGQTKRVNLALLLFFLTADF